jgi:hypothetical protein
MNKVLCIIVGNDIDNYLKDKQKLLTTNDMTRRRSEYR